MPMGEDGNLNDKREERRQEEEGDMHGKIGCKQGARGNIGGGREERTMDIQWKEKVVP